MNNPLAQKYNYYLNESHRLNEELKSEEAYSELLENVLFELLGEEDFTKLFEYVMDGTVTHDEYGRLSPARSARRAHRIAQIIGIGEKGDKDVQRRAGLAAAAKGVTAPVTSRNTFDNTSERITKALQDRSHGEHVPLEVREPHRELTMNDRRDADSQQRYLSKARRDSIQAAKQKAAAAKAAEAKEAQNKKDRAANTF